MMMTGKIIAILVLTISSFIHSYSQKTVALKHYEDKFTFHKNGKGELPKPGEYTVFSMKVVGDNGKVFNDMTSRPKWNRYKQPLNTEEFRPNSPMDEILTLLVAGDSVTWVYNVDPASVNHPMLEGATKLIYGISIKEIVPESEMIKILEAENLEKETRIAAASKKLPDISARVQELLTEFKGDGIKDIQTTSSGLKYLFIHSGKGPKPQNGQLVSVHYYGVLESTGEMFDNSYSRGQQFSFTLGKGEVIKGWEEALALMPKGSEAIFFIPYQIAYGEKGREPIIPGMEMLVFYIEY